jgi:hypothetical protein
MATQNYFAPGWTSQQNPDTEQGAGATFGGLASPGANGYLAWSTEPDDATQSVAIGATATSFGWLTRVFCQTGGPSTKLDLVTATGTPATITGCVFALYSNTSFATGPLAFTASQTATQLTAANSLFSVSWATPSSVFLQAGQYYWVYTTCTFSSTGVLTLAATTATNAAVMNTNQTASATNAGNSMTLSPAPVLFGAVAANSTLTPQTSWANSASKFWFGLK